MPRTMTRGRTSTRRNGKNRVGNQAVATKAAGPDARKIAAAAKALSHPLRVRVLQEVNGKPQSPTELAKALDVPLTHMSYHVRQLAAYGMLRMTRQTPRRGAVEHHYARTAVGSDALKVFGRVVK